MVPVPECARVTARWVNILDGGGGSFVKEHQLHADVIAAGVQRMNKRLMTMSARKVDAQSTVGTIPAQAGRQFLLY